MIDELITTIADETELDEEEIKEEIEAKTEEFSGLVSEEGAAHLVAKAHGVNLAKDVDKELKIESVVPGMSSVNLKAKVLNISDINTFERDDDEEDGKVRNITLGDETGTIRMTLWDEQTKVGEKIDEGDTIQITNAYSREDNRDNAEIRVGNSTKIKRIEEEIESVSYSSSGRSGGGYEDATIDNVINPNGRYAVEGEIVRVYHKNPFYRVCPECNNSLKKDNDYECTEHGEVDPEYRIALPAILDDGFGNIRCVFFNDTAKEVLDAEDKEFNGDTEQLKLYAEAAEGKRIRVSGRSQKNDFFNAIELIVNNVEEIDAHERVKAILEEMENE